MSFVRSGYAYLRNGYLRNVGSDGDYWPAASGDANSAYYLNFTPSNVYPTALYYRFSGFSARCLASGD